MKNRKTVGTFLVLMLLSLGTLGFAFQGGPTAGYGSPEDYGPEDRDQRQPGADVLARLPEDKQALFRRTMGDARVETAAAREEIRVLQAELRDALAAPAFDEDVYRRKLARIEELRDSIHAVMSEALISLAADFSQEEREVLADLAPGAGPSHGKGRRGGRGGPGPR